MAIGDTVSPLQYAVKKRSVEYAGTSEAVFCEQRFSHVGQCLISSAIDKFSIAGQYSFRVPSFINGQQ